MKKGLLLLAGIVMLAFQSQAQDSDSTKRTVDTVKIGNILIVTTNKKSGGDDSKTHSEKVIVKIDKSPRKPKNVSTKWFSFDLGVNNWTDNTTYGTAGIQDPATGLAPGATENWFDLRAGKSINFNLWIVSQKVNLVNHKLNLKYAIGLESNNYRFKRPVLFQEGIVDQIVLDNNRDYSKNKLRTDYVTVPVMLNWDFANRRGQTFGISAGIAAGYLATAKQKTVSSPGGKNKEHADFNLNPIKISYVGELSLGYIKLYGSVATKSIFKDHLDVTPYSIGLRFGPL